MAEALVSGSVDAIATWNPNLYNTQQAFADNEIITFSSDVYTEISVLAGRRDFVVERKGAMEKLVRAVVRAEEFLQDNEAEARDIVIRRLPNQPESTVRGVWDAFHAEAKLDNVLLTVLRQEGQWLKDRGIVEGATPDFTNVIFTDYLESIRPESVTVD